MHFAYNSINCHQEAVHIRSLSSSQTSLFVCLLSFLFKLHCRVELYQKVAILYAGTVYQKDLGSDSGSNI